MIDISYKNKERVYDALSSFLDTACKNPDIKKDWKGLTAELHRVGLKPAVIDAFIFWSTTTLAAIKKNPHPYRILHDIERELISKDAYGCMLESVRLGFVETPQTEFLLEDMASREPLPISSAAMKRTLIKHWYSRLIDSGILRSN